MGGLAACLLARRIVAESLPPPLHLFVTGTSGPSASSREEKKRHLLSKEGLIAELKKLNGSPREVLEDEVLLEYFEPIIRADFRVSENFRYRLEAPMRIPITVITGMEEEMTPEEIGTWQQETCIPVDFIRMPGGHFFLFDHIGRVLGIITEKLSSYLNTSLK
jgi:surfactin synthase thioesterase subunit